MGLIDEIHEDILPVIVSPLAGYHDPPQAKILMLTGAKYMIYPFVSSEGLLRRKKYRAEITRNLEEWKKNIKNNDLHVQIFGSDPSVMSDAASFLEQTLGADIINLNMGCSVKKVWKTGSGSMLLKTPELALRIIEAVCSRVNIPVTLKTRTGWDKDKNGLLVLEKAHELGVKIAMLHPRRGKEKFTSKANWDEISRAVEITRIPVIGNGDIKTPEDAKEMIDQTGVKGVMIGRASIGNPWIIKNTEQFLKSGKMLSQPTSSERIELCVAHLQEIVGYKGESLGVREFRKHVGRYIKGLPDASNIRQKIVTNENFDDIKRILHEYKAWCLEKE